MGPVVGPGSGGGAGDEEVVEAAAEGLGGPLGLVEGHVERVEVAVAGRLVHNGERAPSTTSSWRAAERAISVTSCAQAQEPRGVGHARRRPADGALGDPSVRRTVWPSVSSDGVEEVAGRGGRGLDGATGSRVVGVAAQVDEPLGHADAALAVGDGVVHLLDEGALAVREAVDDAGTPRAVGSGRRGPGRTGWRGRRGRGGCPAREGDVAHVVARSRSGSSHHSGGARRPSAGTTRWRRRGTVDRHAHAGGAEPLEVEGRSRMLMLPKVDERNGSFSRFHIIASTSDMRRSARTLGVGHVARLRHPSLGPCRGSEAVRRGRPGGPPGGGQRPREVCLNSLSWGQPVSMSSDPLDGARRVGVVGGELHEPHERSAVAGDERRDAPHVVAATPPRGPCAPSSRGPPSAIAAHTGSASTPASSSSVADRLGVPEGAAVDVAQVEQGTVHVEEAVGVRGRWTATADLLGEQSAVGVGAVPHGGSSPSATWAWLSENGTQVTSQRAPARRPAITWSAAMRANGHR